MSNLPLAADLRRQVRAKARVRKSGDTWSWGHDCGERITAALLLPSHAVAVSEAVRHVKQCIA